MIGLFFMGNAVVLLGRCSCEAFFHRRGDFFGKGFDLPRDITITPEDKCILAVFLIQVHQLVCPETCRAINRVVVCESPAAARAGTDYADDVVTAPHSLRRTASL